ncbi:MAG: hypothetical protein NVV59_17780 [Chitinophagaceae bacterium]|nr:hypothetical protein [Chitinophagaceae bacterium]
MVKQTIKVAVYSYLIYFSIAFLIYGCMYGYLFKKDIVFGTAKMYFFYSLPMIFISFVLLTLYNSFWATVFRKKKWNSKFLYDTGSVFISLLISGVALILNEPENWGDRIFYEIAECLGVFFYCIFVSISNRILVWRNFKDIDENLEV